MAEGRPNIPADLDRRVRVEAGHRCAIPTCRQWPITIDHIDDWSKVREHRFENLIALCPTCHLRKGDGAGKIDRPSLRQYKANLALINQRYNDVEIRILEYLAKNPDETVITLAAGMPPVIQMLITDRILSEDRTGGSPVIRYDPAPPFEVVRRDGTPIETPVVHFFGVTDIGQDLIRKWVDAEQIEGPTTTE